MQVVETQASSETATISSGDRVPAETWLRRAWWNLGVSLLSQFPKGNSKLTSIKTQYITFALYMSQQAEGKVVWLYYKKTKLPNRHRVSCHTTGYWWRLNRVSFKETCEYCQQFNGFFLRSFGYISTTKTSYVSRYVSQKVRPSPSVSVQTRTGTLSQTVTLSERQPSVFFCENST